jgi:murein DD-endopeptidase MepM/ murein hydrolase activator NlpD
MKKPSKKFWRHTPSPRPASQSFFWHRRLIGKSRAGETAPVAVGAADPHTPQEKPKLVERLWQWIHATFPERQIYIRSDGRVQFFTFGPSLQATLAGLVLIFLGWVAFATVNVVFKDRIIAAKDHRYQQMQAAYENRTADLQTSYDELNAALVSAQDRFKATADALQTKQNVIAGFLNRASQVQASLGARLPATPNVRTRPGTASVLEEAPVGLAGEAGDSSQLVMMPGPAQPQPRTSKPVKSSLLDGMVRRVTSLFHSAGDRLHAAPQPVQDHAAVRARHPGLKFLAEQTQRLARLGEAENLLMAKTEGALGQGIGNLRNIMRRAGINPDAFARKIAGAHGTGGPEIPLNQVRIEGISDPDFSQAYLSAAAVLDQLNGLSAALDHVPLAAPVSGASFDKSSGFGARIDPFTGRYAFHPGIDFAGPWGSVVHATAPGTVVFAGRRGGYGNMVEVDHGYGIHTRYGHLSTISVRVGTHVGRGAGLGRVGSTGRSTGSHVHYEVWYDDIVKNPNKFIEAGRNVL